MTIKKVDRVEDLKPEVSCIILAGGRNARMGAVKAFLRIGDRTIIEEQTDILRTIFDEIIVVTNERSNFRNMDVKVVTDIVPHSGPLGGVYTGLSVSSNIHSFLVGCDMPFINLELVKYMIRNIGENDIVVPISSKGIETLFAVYSINCLETIRKQLEMRILKLAEILKFHKIKYITGEEIIRFDPKEFAFFNVNSPKDYENALRKWCRR